jgi:hypothetical protein
MTLVISKGLTLDNGTRAAAIAGVSPTLDYRFAREKREIETVSLTDKLTYTGGNGTFVGSDGFIQRATTNVPRFDHDPLSRQSLGLLTEGSRENLLPNSETIGITGWGGFRFNVASANVTAPSGKTPVSLVAASETNASGAAVSQNFSPTANRFSLSVFAKAATGSFLLLRPQNNASFGQSAQAWFNLSSATGTLVNSDGAVFANATQATQSFINGWVRCTVSFDILTTGFTGNARLYIVDSSGSLAVTNAASIYLWGAQLEQASTPSTYIPTTTTAVTRTADSAVIDGTGVLTGTYTMVEKPAGCAVVSGSQIQLQPGFTAERVMVFPVALSGDQVSAIRSVM